MKDKDPFIEKEVEDLIDEIMEELISEVRTGDSKIRFGPVRRKLRRIAGQLKIVRRNKKPLPLSLRSISKAAAKRRARRSAISRKGKQKRITKKAQRTTKKGRRMGLYKDK